MARKKKEDESTPSDEFDIGATEVFDDSAPLVPAFEERASVVAPEQSPAPLPERFRVRNGGKIMHRGVVTLLKPGKEVDSRLYDITQLRQQGIDLEPI